ncbi:GAF and ANTAR domain-containing protein [Rhodococcus sp. CC-R104]|uniref:GAF and ANTAR domain-containing protein n=1 Tax=Rhodococcus chondri TaxID=3065941 RepID=A0ABU7JU78_9NOCA|nr:GAF and ANTAR domain-containing protein [Rhodococcus sp. CC-R104]
MEDRRRVSLWRTIAETAGVPGEASWAREVCRMCVRYLAGIDAAALTLRATARAQDMLGASDNWAAQLDEYQYTLGEGPGARAFATGTAVLVPDLSANQVRWPGFTDAAQAIGTGAAFAFPLRIGGIRLGTLDLYRRRPGDIPVRVRADTALIADLITLALLKRAEQAEIRGESWIREAGSYQDVNIATGMLAARLHVSLDDAFLRLRAHAFAQNRPVPEVARDVIDQRIDAEELNE